ncbi:MAG: hypothetical protein M1482_14500 [Chloroflexi bacterium]|nr:hypothetical protein [Chloroflexota bacterium]
MSGETTTPAFLSDWIELANKALDRSPRTAFGIGIVTGMLLKFAPKMRPDAVLLDSISQWADLHRDQPVTPAQIEDLGLRVYDWIGPPRKRRQRVPDPAGGYRYVPRR